MILNGSGEEIRGDSTAPSPGAAPTPEASVLVVAGSAAYREAVRMAVDRESGLRVVALAQSSDEGYRCFLRHRPDIVVVEIGLPDSSGIELVHSIRQADRVCSLILLGRLPDPFVAEVGSLMGADEICCTADGQDSLRKALRRSVNLQSKARTPSPL